MEQFLPYRGRQAIRAATLRKRRATIERHAAFLYSRGSDPSSRILLLVVFRELKKGATDLAQRRPKKMRRK
jgi:hypothetical protein